MTSGLYPAADAVKRTIPRIFDMKLRIILALVSLCAIPSCIINPHTSERSPEIRGRVIDSGTLLPISDATVALQDHPSTAVQTHSDGQFVLPALHNYHLMTIGTICASEFPGGKYYSDKVHVTHPRYRDEEIRARSHTVGGKETDGALRLKDVKMNRIGSR